MEWNGGCDILAAAVHLHAALFLQSAKFGPSRSPNTRGHQIWTKVRHRTRNSARPSFASPFHLCRIFRPPGRLATRPPNLSLVRSRGCATDEGCACQRRAEHTLPIRFAVAACTQHPAPSTKHPAPSTKHQAAIAASAFDFDSERTCTDYGVYDATTPNSSRCSEKMGRIDRIGRLTAGWLAGWLVIERQKQKRESRIRSEAIYDTTVDTIVARAPTSSPPPLLPAAKTTAQCCA
ncbi:hypothetical protein V9T40_004656 [Parthenolecanium corni]|uniref:Uncharacterized protein n=1 Tax=Parthenolecanium corni TaxID=536013 RepID=A0AAN9TCE1_9HEMI